jgi:hypothetical protein
MIAYLLCVLRDFTTRGDRGRGNTLRERRRLSTAQRAACAAELVITKYGGDRSNSGIPLLTLTDAAKLFAVSLDSVKKAVKAKQECRKYKLPYSIIRIIIRPHLALAKPCSLRYLFSTFRQKRVRRVYNRLTRHDKAVVKQLRKLLESLIAALSK